jgi:hypothetical protein
MERYVFGISGEGSSLLFLWRPTMLMWTLSPGIGKFSRVFIFLSSSAVPFLLIQYCIYVVNSITRLASCMIASGCDDGSFTIRDLRLIKVPSSWRSRVLYACLLQTIHLKWCFSLICVLVIYFWVRLLFACLCTQYSERKIEVEWHFEYNRRRVKWHFE